MSNESDPKRKEVIAQYIDENLKQVFDAYASEEMPTEIVDLLNVLRAQDAEAEGSSGS